MSTETKSHVPSVTEGIDLAEIQEKLQGQSGQQLWRSLDELSGSPEFEKWLDDEFPYRSSLPEVDRRDFLRFMGASLILGGLTLSGCRSLPQEKLVPFVKAPEGYVPGEVKQYATAFTHGGYGVGVLAKVFEGRPIKIEGNPDHPASLGATDVFAQAAILGLYDPDRAHNVTHHGLVTTWEEFYRELRNVLAPLKAKRGAGLHILSESISSPTLIWQIGQLKAAFPGMVWHTYDAAPSAPIAAQYRFDRAKVVLSLDADFLQGMPGSVRYAHDFIQKRKIRGKDAQVGRLYAAECTPGLVGAMADHRLALKPSELLNFTLALAGALGLPVAQPPVKPEWSKWIGVLAKDLLASRGASLVVPGDQQPYTVHLLARAINEKLSNGELVEYDERANVALLGSVASVQNGLEGLSRLSSIDALLILGGNPAYDAPGEIKLAEILKKAKFKARYGLYEDETSELCDWHLPATHFLEHWSDARSYDGTFSIVQPATQPLFEGRSPHELLSVMLGQEQSGYEIVRGYWKGRLVGTDQEKAWRTALDSGVVPRQAVESESRVVPPEIAALLSKVQPNKSDGIEIAFRPDPTVWDGRYANLGWLQELPKPITKLTWDNAALISPETAKKLGVEAEDLVEIELNGKKVEAPVWLLPGQPDDVITLHLGYGRTKGGRVGTGLGFDAYKLRSIRSPHYATGAKLIKTGKKWPEGLASTQNHHSMEGRDIVRYGTIAEFQKNPSFKPEHSHNGDPDKMPNLYDPKEHAYDGYQWGMTIDLDRCIGCGVCVIACQAENNIPVVGKSQIQRGRAMHWIRVDRYYGPRDGKGSLENPSTLFQPLTCMHCEQAPCEPVCPVAATVHSKEGLNQMVYNRCVGTRYCSNNCPYKVRRFNFLNYTDNMTQFAENKDRPLLKMLNNPDVTVRGRGVMEKCTYCVQRINHARINAKKQGREVKDGEIVTACQQACPTRAIQFGNIADPKSQVSKLKKEERNYGLLTELNTKPRTSYLARLTNPNPELTEA